MLDAISLPPFTVRTHTQEHLACPMHGSVPTKSSPIQIPKKRRPNVLPVSPPFSQPMSPEMIFEMSPITSESPIRSPFSLGTNSFTNEAFVYKLPMFSPPKNLGNTRFPMYRTSGLSNRMLASLDTPEAQIDRHPAFQRKPCLLDDQDLSLETPTREPGTTRITGFIPMKENLDAPQDQCQFPERLSPGPRRPSYSASPWILPGTDGAEEDIAYSQADPSAFEYDRQLLRRIQNQNRPRLAGLRSYM